MRIAIVTDIHSVHDTLADALTDARAEGYDVLLVLGDLLTYGIAPVETLDLVHEAVERDGAVLVAGNHDAIYLDLAAGDCPYLASAPDWLRETVEWTASRLPAGAMAAFDWREGWSAGSLLAAHANPYPFGDWRPLNHPDEAEAAAATLLNRGFRHGVFGHTHRAARFECTDATIFTLGSLGQPRDRRDPRLRWTMVELADDQVSVDARILPFDRRRHLDAIRRTSLSAATQDRLCGFFA